MKSALTWTDLWAECTKRLGSSDEARHIIEEASGRGGAAWMITLTKPASDLDAVRVHEMTERRLGGEPLQYVLGNWSFRQLDLQVDSRVLIPRPETEQVAQAALDVLHGVDLPFVVDMGTGSGAIALSLALEIPDARVYATDISQDALDVAEMNRRQLPPRAAQRVELLHGSWFDPLPPDMQGRFDLIVSNPPYIGEAEWNEVEDVVKQWEPKIALFSGEDGLEALRHIFENAPQWLNGTGAIVVEIGAAQAEDVRQMAWDAEFFSVQVGLDLADRPRWVTAKRAE